jgi:hypothetical protein
MMTDTVSYSYDSQLNLNDPIVAENLRLSQQILQTNALLFQSAVEISV